MLKFKSMGISFLVLIFVMLSITSCQNKTVPKISKQVFDDEVYVWQDLCYQGGYFYYINNKDDKKIFRKDPDGSYYCIAYGKVFHTLNLNGGFLYCLADSWLGAQVNGLWKISANGETKEKILEDYLIKEYVISKDGTIYFLSSVSQEEEIYGLYKYFNDEVLEVKLSWENSENCTIDRLVLYENTVFYSLSNMDSGTIYSLNTDTGDFREEFTFSEKYKFWLPINEGFALIDRTEGVETLTVILNGKEKEIDSFEYGTVTDVGILNGKLYVYLFGDDCLYMYDLTTNLKTTVEISETVFQILNIDEKLYIHTSNQKDNELNIIEIET